MSGGSARLAPDAVRMAAPRSLASMGHAMLRRSRAPVGVHCGATKQVLSFAGVYLTARRVGHCFHEGHSSPEQPNLTDLPAQQS